MVLVDMLAVAVNASQTLSVAVHVRILISHEYHSICLILLSLCTVL